MHPYDMDVESTKGPKEAIQLSLGLRVLSFMLILGDGAEMCRVMFAISTVLTEDPSNA